MLFFFLCFFFFEVMQLIVLSRLPLSFPQTKVCKQTEADHKGDEQQHFLDARPARFAEVLQK